MGIKSFIEYLKEDVKIPTLDILIDNEGNVHNGKNGTKLIKGNILLKKVNSGEVNQRNKPLFRNSIVDIIGVDGKSYPGGIDKNGMLVGVNIINGILYTNFTDKENFPVKVPDILKPQFGENWTDNVDVENDILKEFILGYSGNILSVCIYANDGMEITLKNKMALLEEDVIIKLKEYLNPYIRDIKIETLLK